MQGAKFSHVSYNSNKLFSGIKCFIFLKNYQTVEKSTVKFIHILKFNATIIHYLQVARPFHATFSTIPLHDPPNLLLFCLFINSCRNIVDSKKNLKLYCGNIDKVNGNSKCLCMLMKMLKIILRESKLLDFTNR